MTEEHLTPADPSQSPTAAVYPDLAGKVAIVGRDQAAIDATVDTITAGGGRAIGVAADCTVEAELDTLRQVLGDQLGPVDILAAFAGGNGAPVPTTDETVAHWRTVIESDLTSTFSTSPDSCPPWSPDARA